MFIFFFTTFLKIKIRLLSRGVFDGFFVGIR